MPETLIYHIIDARDWQQALENGLYQPASLSAEGFIHLSAQSQVEKVLNSYYSAQENLVLLHVDVNKLIAELRWELSDGDTFPHLYGPLNLEAVMQVEALNRDSEGNYRYP